jgi:hypothetical protein
MRIFNQLSEVVPDDTYITKGDILDKMVFGAGELRSPVRAAFSERVPARLYDVPALRELGYVLLYPEPCGNFALLEAPKRGKRDIAATPAEKGIDPQSIPAAPKDKEEPETEPGLTQNPKIPDKGQLAYVGGTGGEIPTQGTLSQIEIGEGSPLLEDSRMGSGQIKICPFEAYAGVGFKEETGDAEDSWHWAKARYYPWQTQMGSVETGLGFYASGGFGSGEDNGYDFEWDRFSVGPSLKVVGEDWDASLDLGLGLLKNKGEEDLYKSEQEDVFVGISASANSWKRRVRGEKWFPETEFFVGLDIIVDSDKDASYDGESLDQEPWDNQRLEAKIEQDIYDLKIGDWRVTPSAIIGATHEWGGGGETYLRAGPGLNVGYGGYEVVSLSAFNWEENINGEGDGWRILELSLDIGGIVKAVKASRITTPE